MSTTNGQPSLRSLIPEEDQGDDTPVDMIDDEVSDDDAGQERHESESAGREGIRGQSARDRQQPETQSGFNLREQMAAMGADVSSYESDEDAFQALTDMVLQMHEQVSDEAFQQYHQHRDEFQQYLQSKQKPAEKAPAKETPKAAPAATADLDGRFAPEIAQAIEHGLLKPIDNGFFEAVSPAFQSAAEEANKVRAKELAFAKQFVSQPNKALTPLLKELLPQLMGELQQPQSNEEVESLKKELAELKSYLGKQQQQAQQTTVKEWVKQNHDHLFEDVNGERKLTAYGKAYSTWEDQVTQEFPNLSPAQRHQKVLNYMKLAGVTPSKPKPKTSEKAVQESLVDRARRRSAPVRGSGDPLQEYAGRMPANAPPVPTGKAGVPSLKRLVAQMENSLGNEN